MTTEKADVHRMTGPMNAVLALDLMGRGLQEEDPLLLQAAQVHATLAVAAATIDASAARNRIRHAGAWARVFNQ